MISLSLKKNFRIIKKNGILLGNFQYANLKGKLY